VWQLFTETIDSCLRFDSVSTVGGVVKIVKIVIPTFKLEAVRKALASIHIFNIIAMEVSGYGHFKEGVHMGYFDAEVVSFVPNIAVEVAVRAADVQMVINAVMRAVKSGKMSDGKIFVLPLDNVIHIRTGESGESAL
jgi:nitrogen regulatory protein PII